MFEHLQLANNMIKKVKNKYIVYSEKTHRRMGTYTSKKDATKRIRQIEYFKHLKKR